MRGKQICCVWDVNTGDVYYRGPQGATLDLEKMAKRREAEKLAEQEAERAAEEIKMDECIAKMDESIAKRRAQVEMRAKLEAEAKLKLERQVTSWCMLQGRKGASGDTGGARGPAEPRCVHAHHAHPAHPFSFWMSFDV